MKVFITSVTLLISGFVLAQFAPAANVSGTTAIHKDSSVIVNWAIEVVDFQRGLEDITNSSGPLASYGDSTAALGYAEGTSTDVVSLGDAGEIVLAFEYPIQDEPGPDFAVFENSFSHDYLEFAHVEVSTDGVNFVRIPSESAVQTTTQTGTYGTTLPEWVHNLAGKYIQGYGTPFDLTDVEDSSGINLDSINFVKIVDVIGTIDNSYGSFDSQGNIINDPYPSAFESGGFDLDGVAVIHENNIFASQQTNDITIKVYPNPAKERLFVTGYSGGYSLIDLTGKTVASGTIEAGNSIELSDVIAGVYILKMEKEQLKIMVR